MHKNEILILSTKIYGYKLFNCPMIENIEWIHSANGNPFYGYYVAKRIIMEHEHYNHMIIKNNRRICISIEIYIIYIEREREWERAHTHTIHSKDTENKNQNYSYFCMLYYFIFFFPIFLYIFPTSIMSKYYLEKWKISNKLLFLTIGHSYMEHNFFQMFVWTDCYPPYVTPVWRFWLHHWIFEINKLEDKAAIPLALGRVLSWWQIDLVGLAKCLWKLMCSATLFLFLYGEKGEVRERLRERERKWMGKGMRQSVW